MRQGAVRAMSPKRCSSSQFAGMMRQCLIPSPRERDSHAGDSQDEGNMIHRGKREGVCHGGCGSSSRGFEAAQIRVLAKRSKNAAQTRRLLALAAIYDGGSRTEAARIGGVGLQTVRDW